jgi:hypothetical protein
VESVWLGGFRFGGMSGKIRRIVDRIYDFLGKSFVGVIANSPSIQKKNAIRLFSMSWCGRPFALPRYKENDTMFYSLGG